MLDKTFGFIVIFAAPSLLAIDISSLTNTRGSLNQQQYQSMTSSQQEDLIVQLGIRKDFETLRAIYTLDLPRAAYAITITTAQLPGSEVLKHCQQFQVGTWKWQAAMLGLSLHNKEIVVPYLRMLARSRDPSVRAHAYFICGRAGWEDLAEFATRDTGDGTCYCNSLNAPFCLSVGDVATVYLSDCGKGAKGEESIRGSR